MSQPKTRRLTAYLMKEGLVDPRDDFKQGINAKAYHLRSRVLFDGVFFLQSPQQNSPDWADNVSSSGVHFGAIASPTCDSTHHDILRSKTGTIASMSQSRSDQRPDSQESVALKQSERRTSLWSGIDRGGMDVIPGARSALLKKADRSRYSPFRVDPPKIKLTTFGHAEFTSFNNAATKLVDKRKAKNVPSRRDKTGLFKIAMMQELLTGRTRLRNPEPAAC